MIQITIPDFCVCCGYVAEQTILENLENQLLNCAHCVNEQDDLFYLGIFYLRGIFPHPQLIRYLLRTE